MFLKGYGFVSFPKNMDQNVGKNKSKNLIFKYSHKVPDHAKTFPTDALKTSSNRVIQKTEEATGDLTGNEIANRIKNLSKHSQ